MDPAEALVLRELGRIVGGYHEMDLHRSPSLLRLEPEQVAAVPVLVLARYFVSAVEQSPD